MDEKEARFSVYLLSGGAVAMVSEVTPPSSICPLAGKLVTAVGGDYIMKKSRSLKL